MSLKHQALALEAFNQTSVSKIRRTAFSVFKLSLGIEAIAAIILALWWWRDYPMATDAYRDVFHAIAAFNNAGFSLFPSRLPLFTEANITLLVISFPLIFVG